MALTPETLPRHEFVGLQAEVVDATDPTQVGIAGEIVTETTRTLAIEGARVARPSEAQPNEEAVNERSERAADRVWHVPKADVTLSIDLPSGESVTVEGDVLVARPARRTEQTGDSQWR